LTSPRYDLAPGVIQVVALAQGRDTGKRVTASVARRQPRDCLAAQSRN